MHAIDAFQFQLNSPFLCEVVCCGYSSNRKNSRWLTELTSGQVLQLRGPTAWGYSHASSLCFYLFRSNNFSFLVC